MIKQIFKTVGVLSLVAFSGQASAVIIEGTNNPVDNTAEFTWSVNADGELVVSVDNTSNFDALITGFQFEVGDDTAGVSALVDVIGTAGDARTGIAPRGHDAFGRISAAHTPEEAPAQEVGLMRRWRPGLLWLCVLAGGLALSSCGGESGRAVEGSTLHRGLNSDPESLDPHRARSVQAADVLRDIGEGLLAYSAKGELIPGVAESWEISEDGLTYTFRIRDTARWSNGDPVTAGQFVYSLRRLVDPATAAFYGQMLGEIVNARAILAGDKDAGELGVEAVDAYTLIIRLEQPVPFLLSPLTHPAAFPVHPGAIEEHGDAFARPGNLLSNGAYVLASWDPGAVIRLVRNEHYWDDASTAIDAVHHHVLTQEMTELNRYRAGELHITGSVPPDSFDRVREELGAELHVAPYLGVYYYGFNLSQPPFRDSPQIREALSMAVDRDVLVESITGRGEKPAYSWVPPGVDNYEPILFSYAPLTQDRVALQHLRYAAANRPRHTVDVAGGRRRYRAH